MAARLRYGTLDQPWDLRVRRRIQTTMLVKRLTEHVKADGDLLTPSQVTAALGLLKKTVPDLSSVELQAGDGGPILIVTGIMRPDEPKPMIDMGKPHDVIDVTPSKADTSSATLTPQAIDKPSKLEHEASSTHKSTHDHDAK